MIGPSLKDNVPGLLSKTGEQDDSVALLNFDLTAAFVLLLVFTL